MPSTRLLAAALAAGALLAAVPAAQAATADLTVTAVGGGVRIYAQTMADGSATLALPHDGNDYDVFLDATGSTGSYWYTFDSNGDGQWDDYGFGGRNARLAVYPALRQERTSAVAVNEDPHLMATLRWRVAYQPEAHLTAPASVEANRGARFDASDSVAWNSATVPRAPARFEWDVEDGKGFSRTTTAPMLVKGFAASNHHACVRVRAVDVSGARSQPVEACTTVTPALFHPQTRTPSITPPPVILQRPHAPIPVPGPVELPS